MTEMDPEVVDELRNMSAMRLSTLRYTSGFLMVFPIICIAALGYVMFKRFSTPLNHVNDLMEWYFFYWFVGITILGIFGSIIRTFFGWKLLLLMGIGFLPLFPLGIAVALFCLNFAITGIRLFGPKRFTGKQLISEFEYRVSKYGYDNA